MFSDLIVKNSRRSRKENGLFFSSLVISIVAFYLILAISGQDVMIFLRKMESDAVNKLMMLIPVFYVMTLVILFFLVYFASKYQLQRRRHEFGVYLMMGMNRGKLFRMLLAEDMMGSILALLIGLPVAVLLSEVISLVTAKLVGMGIIGHRFSVSGSALALTVGGFLIIKLAAFLLLSGKITGQEVGNLLGDNPGGIKKQRPSYVYAVSAVTGIAMLAAAYTMAIRGTAWQRMGMMSLTQFLGVVGTILLFYGMRFLISLLVKRGKGPLHTFNFRQIQENVILKSTSLAISSLLVLAALCCFGAGIGIAGNNRMMEDHVLDYTFLDYTEQDCREVFPKIQGILADNGLDQQFSHLFPMRLGNIHTTDAYENVFQMKSVMDTLESMTDSDTAQILHNNLGYAQKPRVICLSDYNRVLELAGEPQLNLQDTEAAAYISADFISAEGIEIMNSILSERPETTLDGNPLFLTGQLQTTNFVTDRSITLSFALILPDEQFFYYTQNRYDVYVNGVLSQTATEEISLMNAISEINDKLNGLSLSQQNVHYESYLENMGRQLFYMVSASYVTIYLAIIFLVVANTVMGVQFLMNQQQTGGRYQTLVRLGASYETLCKAARKQIRWFMGLPVGVAALSSILGVKALFAGILAYRVRGNTEIMLFAAAAMILLLLVVECLYMIVIRRSSDRYLLTLMEPRREE